MADKKAKEETTETEAKKIDQYIVPRDDFAVIWLDTYAQSMKDGTDKKCMEQFVLNISGSYDNYSHSAEVGFKNGAYHTNTTQSFDHKKAKQRMEAMNKKWEEDKGCDMQLPVLELAKTDRKPTWDAAKSMKELMKGEHAHLIKASYTEEEEK